MGTRMAMTVLPRFTFRRFLYGTAFLVAAGFLKARRMHRDTIYAESSAIGRCHLGDDAR